jgi:signal transduction histidine kinase
MMNQNNLAPLRPLAVVIIFTNAFFIAGKNILEKWGVDTTVVSIGNLILIVVTLLSFWLSRRSLKSANPNVFVRAMYANFMIKLFVCIAAAFIYFMSAKKNINKPALFICMGLYVVYTVIEVSSLTKLLREKKNA